MATSTLAEPNEMMHRMQYHYQTEHRLDMIDIKGAIHEKNKQNTLIKKAKARGKKMVVESMNVSSRILSILDIYTDAILLYKSTQNNVLLLTVLLFLSIISPYVLSYSSGVKLFIFRKTFNNLVGFKKILIILYLLPTGFLYFVLIDILDLLYSIYRWILYNICLRNELSLKILEEELAQQLGMDRMNYEGFKRQKTVGQLMFESIPQLIIQTMLLYGIFPVESSQISNITKTDLYRSITFAVLNGCGQFLKLYIESLAVDESFVQYSLHAMMSRVGWIPFKMKIIQHFREESCSERTDIVNIDNIPIQTEQENQGCFQKVFGVKYIHKFHDKEIYVEKEDDMNEENKDNINDDIHYEDKEDINDDGNSMTINYEIKY